MKFFKITFLLLAVAWAFWFGRSIHVSDQLGIIESLRTTASIVFGVIGAWIALIYPQALEDLISSEGSGDGHEKNLVRLLRPLLYSTLVLGLTLLFDFAFLVAHHIHFLVSNPEITRRLSFCFVTLLTILQAWALILSLGPTDSVKQELQRLRARKEYVKELRSRIGKAD